MQTHIKDRIEIVIEAPVLERMLNLIRKAGVTGYTVLPAMAGAGSGGEWSEDSTFTEAQRMVVVLCITDPSRTDAVLEPVFRLLSRHIGIVTVGKVEVIRGERF
jgi:PII-like signaling protein